jgi:hypothetical protein
MRRNYRYQDTRSASYVKSIRVLFLLLFASGCAIALSKDPTPSPVTLISEQAAREQAVKIASTDDFHFTGAAGPVSNVRAEKMTFQLVVSQSDMDG